MNKKSVRDALGLTSNKKFNQEPHREAAKKVPPLVARHFLFPTIILKAYLMFSIL